MDFTARYAMLNDAQKQAVDTVEGPLMVIAGPGTGKTELLSVRTANILKKTDTLPENILCLTFTESGASAMRERLTGIIGKDAYKVAIHTFHSFGTDIINSYGEFFYHGAHFRPADDVSRHELLRSLFDNLGHANVLNKKMNGDYTYLSDTQTVISELKKSGLTSDELLDVLDSNDGVIEKTEQLLSPIFAKKISKSTADEVKAHIDKIRSSAVTMKLPSMVPLATIIADSLQTAVDTASADNSTKPITAWRNEWFKKNDEGVFVLKSHERQIKLRAVSSIYEQYLSRMEESELYDFDDMILRVVHAIEVFDTLRFNLQEKYQYIMVDEFQDTNMAQMRIIHNLTNNIAHGDSPNIMVVGDDDQAIYSFQGADISNIINFTTTYPTASVITLTDNYRSGSLILDTARNVIVQGAERLENSMTQINKQLHSAGKQTKSNVALNQASSSASERHWLVAQISSAQKSGTPLSSIAVLTRKHQEIERLLPYLTRAGIAVSYERRDNVLDIEPIVIVEQLAELLHMIATGDHARINAQLGTVLAHPAWNILATDIWQLSLSAYQQKQHWIDVMATLPAFVPLQKWLIETSFMIAHTPLEIILDRIIGVPLIEVADTETDDESSVKPVTKSTFISPLYQYFFADTARDADPSQYVRYLEALRTIRTKLRDYQPYETPTLESFIEFIALHRTIGSGITSIYQVGDEDAVQLMTAHKSKGLEFDIVYIIGAVDSVWGERARSRSRMISYPENLPIAPAGDSSDERLRLFYVAMTRAKQSLIISYAVTDDANKPTTRASFLIGQDEQTIEIDENNTDNQIETAEAHWYETLSQSDAQTLEDMLRPQLKRYQLSVTHLTNFLDVTRGGPHTFLTHNLLRFPQAMSPASAYGSAIHATLQRAHGHLTVNHQRQAVEDVLHNFETNLEQQRLAPKDFEFFLQKGSEDLTKFLDAKYATFDPSQKTEINFKSQQVIVGEAHLSGALDLMQINDKSVTVTDYKTGKPARSWTGKTEYEKIKLHKYKQQLMFYKLLIEHARDYRGHQVDRGVIQFIEPSLAGDILALDLEFTNDELTEFKNLIDAVWKHIISLSLPSVAEYPPTLKGIIAFEQDLITDTI